MLRRIAAMDCGTSELLCPWEFSMLSDLQYILIYKLYTRRSGVIMHSESGDHDECADVSLKRKFWRILTIYESKKCERVSE